MGKKKKKKNSVFFIHKNNGFWLRNMYCMVCTTVSDEHGIIYSIKTFNASYSSSALYSSEQFMISPGALFMLKTKITTTTMFRFDEIQVEHTLAHTHHKFIYFLYEISVNESVFFIISCFSFWTTRTKDTKRAKRWEEREREKMLRIRSNEEKKKTL